MADYSYATSDPVLVEAQIGGKPVDVVVDNVSFRDGVPYLTGTYSANYGDDVREVIIPLDAGEFPSLEGMKIAEREKLFSGGTVEALIEKNLDGMILSDGAQFPDKDAALRDTHAQRTAIPAAPPVDTPAIIEDAPEAVHAHQAMQLREPVLIETSLAGQPGDMVLHNIDYVDETPFISGTFTVQTPTGTQTKEFMLQIDPAAVPELNGMNEQGFQAMLDSGKHEIILSQGEGFPDRSRLMQDITQLSGMGEDTGHVRLLALMGQEHPGFVDNLDRYLNTGAGPDNAIKMAVLDAVGVSDVSRRESLIYGSADLDDFIGKVSQDIDLADRGTKSILNEISGHVREMSAVETAADIAGDLSKAAKAARLGGHLPAVGIVSAVAGAGMTSAASAAQRDYADDLHAQGIISDEALMAYRQLSTEMEIAMQADNVINTADPTGLSIIGTIGLEMKARAAFEEWVDTYAPNLPADAVDTLSMSMLGTQSAQSELLMGAVDTIPESLEGVPQGLHAMIEASNAFKTAQQALENSALGIAMPTEEQNREFYQLAGLRDQAFDSFMTEMEGAMRDPENIAAFMDMMPVDDRMDFMRRLAESESNPDVMAAKHPQVAGYLAAYEDANIFQTRLFGFAEDTALRENPGAINDYIMDRLGLTADEGVGFEELNELIAGADLPDNAPPELAAFAALAGQPEAQREFYNDLDASGALDIVSSYVAQNDIKAIATPPPETEIAAPQAERPAAAQRMTI